MSTAGQSWLVAGGLISALGATAHVGAMFGGAPWFRFMGAPPEIVAAVNAGKTYPYIITTAVAVAVYGWAAYAFSAAKLIPSLPFLRAALVVISAFCVVRGLCMFTPYLWLPEHSQTFRIVSSTIVLIIGMCFALGTRALWADL